MSINKVGGPPRPKVQPKKQQEVAPPKPKVRQGANEVAGAKAQGLQAKGGAAAEAARQKARPSTDGFTAAAKAGAKNEVKLPSLAERAGTGRLLDTSKSGKPQGLFETINNAADRLGGALQGGGKLLEQGGQLLSGRVPGADTLREVGRAAQQAGSAIQDAPEVAAQVPGEVQRQAQALAQRGQEALEQVQAAAQPLIERGVEGVRQGVEVARGGVEALSGAVVGFGRDLTQALDINANVQALGEGDSYTLKVGIEGGAGVQVGAEHQIEVKHEEGKYTVSADSSLSVGVDIGVNVKVPGFAAGPEAEAKASAGAKVEYEFKSAEDAARGAEILAKQARANALATAASSSPLGPLAGQAAHAALAPSQEELRFLADNVAAVEFKVSGQASASVEAALGERGIAAAAAGLEGEVSTARTLRVELSDGKPSALVIKSEAEGKLSGSAGAGVSGSNEAAGSEGSLSLGLGAGGSIKIESETKVPLPGNFDPAALGRDPSGTLQGLLRDTANGVETKTSVTLDGKGKLVSSGGGLEAKVEFSGKPADLVRSGALPALAQGDLVGALRDMGDKIQVAVTLSPYTQHGVALSPEVEVSGVGVGVELEAVRKDVAESLVQKHEGSATDAARLYGQFLQQRGELLNQGQPGPSVSPQMLLSQMNPEYQAVSEL